MTDATSAISPLARDAESRAGGAGAFALQAAILFGLTCWLYRMPIDGMIFKWKTDGNWSHGWLVPLFSAYFLVVHRDRLLAAPRRGNLLGLPVVVGSVALMFFAALKHTLYPQQVTLVPCLLGIVLLVWGWRVLHVAWFPIVYLMFAVPLPRWLYFEVTFPLRRIASLAGGMLLSLIPDVYTQVQGLVIDYTYLGRVGSLNVEEACSGMRLIMALCALGVAMAYLGDRPLWHRVIMVLSCVPIAVFCNTLRVFTTGVFHVYGHEDWAQGTAHELVGLGMLPIALGLFAAVGYVLKHLFVDEAGGEVAPG